MSRGYGLISSNNERQILLLSKSLIQRYNLLMPIPTPPFRLPWSASDVPHATLEVNQACNIRCHACYKDKFAYSKPLELICREVDFLLTQRKLASLTIAGGEPTLYPELDRVVAYIHSKGIRPILLTNGTLLTEDLLTLLKNAGLVKVMLHIDGRQYNRPDTQGSSEEIDLIPLRAQYVKLALKVGLEINFAVTLYRDALEEFQKFIYFCQKTPAVSAVLITNYSHFLNHSDNTADEGLSLRNSDIVEFMRQKESANPTWYVPSTKNDCELQWLLYTGAFTAESDGKIHALYFDRGSPVFFKLIPRLPRWLKGRYSFDDPTTLFQKILVTACYGLLSARLGTLARTIQFLGKAARNRNLKLLTLVFQQSPTRLASGEYETCLHCPDATVRNFKLLPLCLADKIEPLRP